MSWLVFALATYLVLVLELGLRPVWMLSAGGAGGVSPSLLLVLAVFVGLHAPTRTVMWAMLALGAVADFASSPMAEAVLVGPTTLGYLVGGYAVLQLRTMVFRQSLISLAALVLTVGIFVELVTVGLFTVRGIPWLVGEPIPGWRAADELVHRFLELIYSTIVALPVGAVLFRSIRAWGFPGKERRFAGA